MSSNEEDLTRAGLDLSSVNYEQKAIINSLSSQEVNALIGLKRRLDSVPGAEEQVANSGAFIW
jgi:hypothetical protein